MLKHLSSYCADKKLILALSGGIDSMVLADMLLKAKVDFVLAHCNFHLRGEESDGDERFVREYAERNGLKIYVKQFDTTGYAKESRAGKTGQPLVKE